MGYPPPGLGVHSLEPDEPSRVGQGGVRGRGRKMKSTTERETRRGRRFGVIESHLLQGYF